MDKALLAEGLASNPDVLFRDNKNRQLIVSEARSRRFKGSVTPYERYQVTLYPGMVHRLCRQFLMRIPACRQALSSPTACCIPDHRILGQPWKQNKPEHVV